MLKISVCPAVAEDAEAIAALNESCFGQTMTTEKVRKQLKALIALPQERVLVAVYRGRLVGYVHAGDSLRTFCEPSKTVYALAVDKDCRRKGVGRALWEAVLAWAQESGCGAVNAAVGSSKTAQSFFAAVGCREMRSQKEYSCALKAAEGRA